MKLLHCKPLTGTVRLRRRRCRSSPTRGAVSRGK
nr:MAG TPA: hypothetical protein [Caudoviricetes sp.]